MSKRKQRTFMVSDILHYLIGIACYHECNNMIVDTCYDTNYWNGVGLSIFKGGWNQLAIIMMSAPAWNGKVVAYDETAMESCVTVAIQQAIYDMRHSFVEGPYLNACTWYLQNIMYGLVVDHNGKLYLKVGQNPSGHHNTLVDNNHALELKMLYHLAKNCFDVTELVQKYEAAHVKLVGDDSIVPDNPELWDGLLSSSEELGFNTTLETDGAVPITEVKFLNFGFELDVDCYMYTFVPDYDKLFAGLFFYMKSHSWRLCLARLYAMKILCYSNLNRYKEVCDYIDLVKTSHKFDLVNETRFDEIITLDSLHGQDKSRDEIRRLLFNLE